MAYIDSNYGNELEAALRKLVSRPALGQPWFGFHESEVPVGVLLFTAGTHSRILYADFWQYVQDKNLVKTEEEWQSIYSTQGWCPFYSDGDGIDTFRMPSAPLYLHGANTLDEAGAYVAEGLPNITGSLTFARTTSDLTLVRGAIGAFSRGNRTISAGWGVNITSESNAAYFEDFDASLSNSIYGASDHVTPATSKLLFGVWAISAPQQPIPDATVEGVLSSLELKAGTDLSNLTTAGKGVAAKMSLPSDRYVDLALGASGISYTMQGDGYLVADYMSANSNVAWVRLQNLTTSLRARSVSYSSSYGVIVWIPVRKGDKVEVSYVNMNTSNGVFLRFIYAEGAE